MMWKQFIALLGVAGVAFPILAQAQNQPRVYAVGALNVGSPVTGSSRLGAALLRGLTLHGYALGQNLRFESLGADMNADRLPKLLDDLVASHVDVIVAFGYPASLVAKQKTSLPVVSITAGDPVGTGLVDSLVRPGGHLTGISDVSAEITPKRMELLKEVTPGLRHLAVIWNAADPGMTLRYRASEAGAATMGIKVQALGVRTPEDFDQVFAAMVSDKPDAILMVSDVLTSQNRKRVIEFAAAHRVPAIFENEGYVRDGGLMSYGPDLDESLARVADLVDHILKGVKPSELPFEQPTRFRMTLNLKTAKILGLTVSPSFLALTDEVIE